MTFNKFNKPVCPCWTLGICGCSQNIGMVYVSNMPRDHRWLHIKVKVYNIYRVVYYVVALYYQSADGLADESTCCSVKYHTNKLTSGITGARHCICHSTDIKMSKQLINRNKNINFCNSVDYSRIMLRHYGNRSILHAKNCYVDHCFDSFCH